MTNTDVQWCRKLFSMLADGGTWGVPRSGLFFQKQSDCLVLQSTMPHTADMPMTEAALKKYQQEDFAVIQEHFAAAGIMVQGEK